MKSIVVYYSLEGNTDYVAREVAKHTGADLLRLEPEREYPKGKVSKYVWGGKSVVFGEKPSLRPYQFNKDLYDLIIIATPIWASSFAPPIRSFFADHDLRNKNVAFICCSAGGDTQKCRQQLIDITNVPTLTAELNLIEPLKQSQNEVNGKILEFCTKLM